MGKSEGATFKVDRGGTITEGGDAAGPEDVGMEGRVVESMPRGMAGPGWTNPRRGEGIREPPGSHSAIPSGALHPIVGEAAGPIS